MGMWGWGFLASPALSGILAEPMRQYPDSVPDTFSGLLTRFPFLLPNLLSAIFCTIGILAVHYVIPETLPNSRHPLSIPLDTIVYLRESTSSLICCRTKTKNERDDSERSTLLVGSNTDSLNEEKKEAQYDSFETQENELKRLKLHTII